MKRILLVGSGWRAETWATLIMKLPDFSLTAVVCRGEEKACKFSSIGAVTVENYEQGLEKGADLVLVCVSKGDGLSVSRFFAAKGFSVLCETPAASDEGEYTPSKNGEKIFIAEQYPLQPRFAALKKIADEGALGRVHTLFLSCCHEYHAIALVRRLLNTGDIIPKVSATSFDDEYSVNRGRRGNIPPTVGYSRRTLAFLDFGNMRAVYDFSKEQYFSAIRRSKIILQGTAGEIVNENGCLRRGGSDVPCSLDYVYDGKGGSLYPPDLSAIFFLGEKVYENPWKGLRMSEEEIAMAECLNRFSSGKGYPAKEGAIDARIAEKLKSGN